MILHSDTSLSFEKGLHKFYAGGEVNNPLPFGLGNPLNARPRSSFSAEEKGPGGEDKSLDEAAKDEREYVRRRLREALGREPSEEEVDEWLRQHTEGY